MNRPPAEYTLLPADELRSFIAQVFTHAAMPADKAAFLADLLVTNDLRGVFSHGTQQTTRYVEQFQDGELTPAAEITTLVESPTMLVLDGGGGLGYFPCHQATTRLIAKAQESGIAVATTRNHGHFGAAGIYARIPLDHDLFCYVTSGHQLNLHPGDFVMSAAGGSPMAFGIPTGVEPPFVLDFGAIHDMYLGPEAMKPILELVPSTVLRSFGLGCACQALGGLLCGVPIDAERAQRAMLGRKSREFYNRRGHRQTISIRTVQAGDGRVRAPGAATDAVCGHRAGAFTRRNLGCWRVGGSARNASPPVRIVILRLKSGELLIIASRSRPQHALKIYRQRWKIETLFAALKTRGFNLEATHMTDPVKLSTLIAILAMAASVAYKTGLWALGGQPRRCKAHGRPARSLFALGLDALREAEGPTRVKLHGSVLHAYREVGSAPFRMAFHWGFQHPLPVLHAMLSPALDPRFAACNTTSQ